MEGGIVSDTERYRQALIRSIRGEPLDEQLATEVWLRVHQIFRKDPEGEILKCLYDRLGYELNEGLRCGACGRYGSSECAEHC